MTHMHMGALAGPQLLAQKGSRDRLSILFSSNAVAEERANSLLWDLVPLGKLYRSVLRLCILQNVICAEQHNSITGPITAGPVGALVQLCCAKRRI